MSRVIGIRAFQENLNHLQESSKESIEDMVRKVIKENDYLGLSPYIYIFAHMRELGLDEKFSLFIEGLCKSIEEAPKARLIWQPRLKKPEAQPNSMLFRVDLERSDDVEVVWILPREEVFSLYKWGKALQEETIFHSIHQFLNNRKELERAHADDLCDERIKNIYDAVSHQAKINKKMKNTFQRIHA